MREWSYTEKSKKSLASWYYAKARLEKSKFIDYLDFLNWYTEEPKVCYYCGIREDEMQEIVHKGILTSKRFPKDGKFARGVNRGYHLEIDQKKPKEGYGRDNAVLACYFCNNDKSDVFADDNEYLAFYQNRARYLRDKLRNA